MGEPRIAAWCNHCDKGYATRVGGSKGLCASCFIDGHRGRKCDEYCKPSIVRHGNTITRTKKLIAELDEHQRLRDAVVEAACEFIDDDCTDNREALYIARAALRDFEFLDEEGKGR